MKIASRIAVLGLVLTTPALAQQPDPPIDLETLRAKPIADGGGKVGELLRQWWKEGTAAGNAGDCYDNRDGDHSPLNLKPWPQFTAIKYSPQDIQMRKHWAAQRVILPYVTFGNSSTSAPAHLGGSNPRSYYISQFGLNFLNNQYTKNNLYIYPEHRDHDPGHNGKNDGYGDMYPTNTPYLMISQGSSGSDQPFMRMMPYVLAAFRPEVKKKLTETGTLMPTIQMLFRSTNKHLKDPKEYLTGKAHPTVFEGSWVDELAMVQRAHALELKSLPPIVQLRVLEEDKAVQGIDYFDPYLTESLAYTPSCIARVHRSRAQTHRLVVSADRSYDHNKKPLTYTWVVLRGDPNKIKIVPKKNDPAVAEITVVWHERRPVSPGSPLESNRVDIGVFVHNGDHYSAPAFVTVATLDREWRTYNPRGVPLEVAHGLGETDIRIPDWEKMLNHLSTNANAATLLKISEGDVRLLVHLAEVYSKRVKSIAEANAVLKEAEAVLKNAKEKDKDMASKGVEAARKTLADAQKNANDFLDKGIDPLGDSVRNFVESHISKLARDPLFTQTHQDWLAKARNKTNEVRIKAPWQKMFRLGIAAEKENLTALLPGNTLADTKWTKFELAQLEWLHATLIAETAFPGVLQVEYRTNFVDQRLSAPREWRDVQRFDPVGNWIGWRRYGPNGNQMFNHEGLLVVERDDDGRCLKGREMIYVRSTPKKMGFDATPLMATPTDTIVRYEFADKSDWRGKRAGTEPGKDNK